MRNLLILVLLSLSLGLSAQRNLRDSAISVPLIQFSYAGQLPAGNLAHRFGFNSNLDLNVSYKTRTNWIYGVDFTYIFGNQIRENGLLDSISTKSQHLVIDVNGELADVRLYERGFTANAWLGRIFPFPGNRNSGLNASLGLGFMEHHIKIEDIGNKSPQLAGDLKKGYDRLTNGPSVSAFLGYTYLSNNRFLNFFFGLETTVAFTQDRRPWDYELMKRDDAQRIDILYGLRAGWILPLYRRVPEPFYYN